MHHGTSRPLSILFSRNLNTFTRDLSDSFLTLETVDHVLRTRVGCGRNVGVLKGRDIGFQTFQQPVHLHGGWNITEPDMHAGLQLVEMTLHSKTWLLHEIRGKEASDGLYNPGMFFRIPVADPKLHQLVILILSGIHRGTLTILTLRLRERTVYGSETD